MMPTSTPSRYTPASVTRAGNRVPSLRRTGNPPDQGIPSRSAAMMSAAMCCPTSGTVSSAMFRPTASPGVHPYRSCAAAFQYTTTPCGSVVITA